MAQAQWNRGSGYTSEQMMQMQRDAERRVREMQRQADRNLGQSRQMNPSSRTENLSSPQAANSFPQSHQSNSSPPQSQHSHPPVSQQNSYHPYGGHPSNPITGFLNSLSGGSSGGHANSISGILSNFGIGNAHQQGRETPLKKVMEALHLDNERLMLIFLIILLLNDGGDTTLILALCYIIL